MQHTRNQGVSKASKSESGPTQRAAERETLPSALCGPRDSRGLSARVLKRAEQDINAHYDILESCAPH